MECCSVCSSIRRDALPIFPEEVSPYYRRLGDGSYWDLGATLNDTRYNEHRPFGFPYHDHLDALAASAKSCNLCALVHCSVETWAEKKKLYDHAQTSDWADIYSLVRCDFPLFNLNGRKLWICRNEGAHVYPDARRLLVFVQNWGRYSSTQIIVLAEIGFAVDVGSPLAHHISQRPIDPYTGSETSLATAASWLETCVRDHECSDTGPAQLPTRVLDVDKSTEDSVKLVETNGTSGYFVALSYCWGASPNFTTERSTLESRRQGISIKHLPQTMQDAIVITRGLGIRYLWIDALCIVQDDEVDWAKEAAQMANIFSVAQLVIAVSHARDTSIGCFRERPIPPSTIVRLPTKALLARNELEDPSRSNCPSHSDVHATNLPVVLTNSGRISTEHQPIDYRGWTLQECYLARRLLNYTTNDVIFRCGRGRVVEDGSCDRDAPMVTNRKMLDGRYDVDGALKEWYRLAQDYSRRRLAKRGDTLPALSGLARHFALYIKVPYVAGMWLNESFAERLCWRSLYDDTQSKEFAAHSTAPSTLEYTVPTWSWLSSVNVAWPFAVRELFLVLESHINKPKADANPWGEITDAEICFRAPSFRLEVRLGAGVLPIVKADGYAQWNQPYSDYISFTQSYRNVSGPETMRVRVITCEDEQDDGDEHDLQMIFDHRAMGDPDAWCKKNVFVLPICEDLLEDCLFGLVITDLDDPKHPGRMKRIGYMGIPVEDPYFQPHLERVVYDEKSWKRFVLR